MNKEIAGETAEKVQDEDEERTNMLEDKWKYQICRMFYGNSLGAHTVITVSK